MRIALALFIAATIASADNGDGTLEKARAAWEKGDYAEAAAQYTTLRDKFPKNDAVTSGDAQFWLWCSLANSGKTKESVAEIETFLAKYPKHGSCDYALFFLGQHLRQLGEEDKAKAAWERLLKDYPKSQMADMAKKALSGEMPVAGGEAAPPIEDFREGAEAAARWLLKQAVEKDGGLEWPEYEGTKAHPCNLYEGSAGIVLYFLNLYRSTHDPRWLDAAKKGAKRLLSRARKTKGGLEWEDESEDDDGKVSAKEPSPAYYVGAAGIGATFLALNETTQDKEALEVATSAADAILAAADREGKLVRWGEDTDDISGAAGIGFFLLEMKRVTYDEKYLEAAVGAADWLISVSVKDGDGLKWKSTAALDRYYTGFSHGTAGIVDYLLRVEQRGGDGRFLAAAEAGARWLARVATKDGDGLKWFHFAPDHADQYMTGWCHGPAGTCRPFLDLYCSNMGKNRFENLQVATGGAAWLMKQMDPTKKETVFYGTSMCCGATGIGDYFLDLFLLTNDDRYLEYAAGVGRWLLAHAKRDGDGMKWTNYDAPDEKGVIYYGTGFMTGAAGVGNFLIRLDCVLRGDESRMIPTLDKPRYAPREKPEEGSYVVLSAVDPKGPWQKAASRLAEHRHGTVVPFRVDALASAQRRLALLGARYVAIVLGPRDLDVNLHRRMLRMSTRMDEDPYCDFAFGYITGPTPEAALALVEGAIAVEKDGLPKSAVEAAVINGSKSYTVDDPPCAIARALGYEGEAIYWAEKGADPDVLEFVQKHIKDLEHRGIVSLGGNSDPEGIWLFDDHRNTDESKHWPFDPKRVGEDPKGEMPRILAKDLRGLDLSRTVVWSGTCHSAVTYREFVGPDIVSTFGTVDKTTEYLVPADRSLALAILGDGPSAFLAPIGPNHGYATLVELHRALATGMSLGDLMRSRYDEIILDEGGRLVAPTFVPGEPEPEEDPMRGGGVNRLLFGDPAYRPFPAADRDAVKATSRLDGKTLHVRCEVVSADDGVFWDMFGGDRENPERVYAVVELPAGFGEVGSVTATSDVALAKECRWGVEELDGKRLLHLQANGKSDTLGKAGVVVEFTVSPR